LLTPDDTDWERVKLGRFNDADERLVRGVMGPWFLRTRQSRSAFKPRSLSPQSVSRERHLQVLLSRANMVSLGHHYSTRKQAVVKVGFYPKSRDGVVKQVRYVARLRPVDMQDGQQKSVPIWDGFGAPLERDDAASIADTWELPQDHENLSKTARMLLKQNEMLGFQALSTRKKLRNIQTWHFILSIGEGSETLEPFRAAVRATVDAAFTAHGHQSMWAIHADHTLHLHAHVIVKAQSEFGGRIHSDIRGDYLHQLRVTFAGNLRRVGLDYEATRRVDRRPLRELIMAGQVPLREENLPRRKGAGSKAPYAAVPNWSRVHGQAAVEGLKQVEAIRHHVRVQTDHLHGPEKSVLASQLLRKVLDQTPRKSRWWAFPIFQKKNQAQNAKLTKAEWELMGHLEKMYHDPRPALESFRLMSSDGAYRDENGKAQYPNKKLAAWTLRHRPELFGQVKADAFIIGPAEIQIRMWSPERLRTMAQTDNTFADDRRLERTEKNRKSVLTELKLLHGHIENIWPESRRLAPIAQAIRQAKRIRDDDRILYAEAPETSPTVPASVEKRSTASSTSGSDGGGGKSPEHQSIPRPVIQSVRKTKPTTKRKGLER